MPSYSRFGQDTEDFHDRVEADFRQLLEDTRPQSGNTGAELDVDEGYKLERQKLIDQSLKKLSHDIEHLQIQRLGPKGQHAVQFPNIEDSLKALKEGEYGAGEVQERYKLAGDGYRRGKRSQYTSPYTIPARSVAPTGLVDYAPGSFEAYKQSLEVDRARLYPVPGQMIPTPTRTMTTNLKPMPAAPNCYTITFNNPCGESLGPAAGHGERAAKRVRWIDSAVEG